MNNGPELRKVEEQIRLAALRLEHRLTQLEGEMRMTRYVGGLLGSILVGVMVLLIVGVIR
jgi:hypothetical protein